MRCSICKTELVRGEDKKYETLEDHVSDPNKVDYPFRPTFVCPNLDCSVHKNSFWDPTGAFFTSLDLDSYYVLRDGPNAFVGGESAALDSLMGRLDRKEKEITEEENKKWASWLEERL